MKVTSKITTSLLLGTLIAFTMPAFAEESEVAEDTKEVASDVKKSVKKGARKVKDETCELVNGKMECVGKKLKHKAQNVGDELKD